MAPWEAARRAVEILCMLWEKAEGETEVKVLLKRTDGLFGHCASKHTTAVAQAHCGCSLLLLLLLPAAVDGPGELRNACGACAYR